MVLWLMCATALGVAQTLEWSSNLSAAKARARAESKPLLILFVLEGCPDCARMERSLSDPRVTRALEPFVKVMLEFNEYRDIAARYGIAYTPTLLVYLPTDNFASCHERHVGSLSPSALVRLAGRILNECEVRTAPRPEQMSPQKGASQAQQKSPPTEAWIAAQRYFAAMPSRSGTTLSPSFHDIYRNLTQRPTLARTPKTRQTP